MVYRLTKSAKLKLDKSGLLAPGIHEPALHEFREVFVDGFPSSETRDGLYKGYLSFSQKCVEDSLVTTHWLDGSYVTNKNNPGDIDLAMKVNAAEVAQHVRKGKPFGHGQPFYRDHLKEKYGCHVFVIMEYPKDDPRYKSTTKKDEDYWLDMWGHTKDQPKKEKGFIQFDLRDGEHCENVNEEIVRIGGV